MNWKALLATSVFGILLCAVARCYLKVDGWLLAATYVSFLAGALTKEWSERRRG